MSRKGDATKQSGLECRGVATNMRFFGDLWDLWGSLGSLGSLGIFRYIWVYLESLGIFGFLWETLGSFRFFGIVAVLWVSLGFGVVVLLFFTAALVLCG